MRFRKKPVVIDAMQVPLSSRSDAEMVAWGTLGGWLQSGGCDCLVVDATPRGHAVEITTLEGTMRADPGDWIIRGVKGEYYPCKPDVFEATYEPVEEPAPERAP